jgi:hypothetical protein
MVRRCLGQLVLRAAQAFVVSQKRALEGYCVDVVLIIAQRGAPKTADYRTKHSCFCLIINRMAVIRAIGDVVHVCPTVQYEPVRVERVINQHLRLADAFVWTPVPRQCENSESIRG